MNITTLAQLNAANIDDIDATDIAYLTLNLPNVLFETTRNGQTLLSQLPPSLVQFIQPEVFAVDGSNPNDRPLIRFMTQAQRLALTWEQLTTNVTVVTKVGNVTQSTRQPVLSQIDNFADLSADNRAKLTYAQFAALSVGFLRTATHDWLTQTTLDAQNASQTNLKFLSQAQWTQLRNLNFSQISSTNLAAWLPDVPLSDWTVQMLGRETATVASGSNPPRKIKVLEVLTAKQLAGALDRLSLLDPADVALLKDSQLTEMSADAWLKNGFLASLDGEAINRLNVPASVLAMALGRPGTADIDGKPRTQLTVSQIGGLSATQLTTVVGTTPLINRIINAGQADALNPAKFTSAVVALLSPELFRNNVFSRSQLMTFTANGTTRFVHLLSTAQLVALDLSRLNQADIQALTITQQANLSKNQFAQTTLDGRMISSFLDQSASLNVLWNGIRDDIAAVAAETNAKTKAILRAALVTKIQGLGATQLKYTLPESGLAAMNILGAEYIAELKPMTQITLVADFMFRAGLLKHLTWAQLESNPPAGTDSIYKRLTSQKIGGISALYGINWNTTSVTYQQRLNTILFLNANGIPSTVTDTGFESLLNNIRALSANLGSTATDTESWGKNSIFLQTTWNNKTVLEYFLDTVARSTGLSSSRKNQLIKQSFDLNFFRYAAGATVDTVVNGQVQKSYVISSAVLNRLLDFAYMNNSSQNTETMRIGGVVRDTDSVRRAQIYAGLLDSGRYDDISFVNLYGDLGTHLADIQNVMTALSNHSKFKSIFVNAREAFFAHFGAEGLEKAFQTTVYDENKKGVELGTLAIKWISWTKLTRAAVQSMGNALNNYLNSETLTDVILKILPSDQINWLNSGTLSLMQFNMLSDTQKYNLDGTSDQPGRLWWQKLDDGTPIISLMTERAFKSLVTNNPTFVIKIFQQLNIEGRADLEKGRDFLNTTLADSNTKLYQLLPTSILEGVDWVKGSLINGNTYDKSTSDGTKYSDLLDFYAAKYIDLSTFDDAFVADFLDRTFIRDGNVEDTATGRQLMNGYNLDLRTRSGTKIIDFFTDAQIGQISSEQMSMGKMHYFWEQKRNVTKTRNGVTTTTNEFLYTLLDPTEMTTGFWGFSAADLESELSDGSTLRSKLGMGVLAFNEMTSAEVGRLTALQVTALTQAQLLTTIKDGTKLLKSISAATLAEVDWAGDNLFPYWVVNEFSAAQLSQLSYAKLTSTWQLKIEAIGKLPKQLTVSLIQLLDDAKFNALSDNALASLTAADLQLDNYLGGTTLSRLSSVLGKLSVAALAKSKVIDLLTARDVSTLAFSQLETYTATNKYFAELLTQAQAAGLTMDQLDTQFTNTVPGYTTKPKLIQFLGATQLGGLSDQVLEDLTSTQLLLKDKDNITVLSKLSVRGIGKLNGAALQEAGVITVLSDAQAGGLTVAQLSRASTIAVDHFLATDRPMLIQRLSDTQLGNLSNAVLDTITSAMLLAQNKDGETILSNLTDTQLGKLGNALSSSSVLAELTSSSKIGVLTLGQLSRFSSQTMTIQRLTSAQLGHLSDTVLANLTPAMLLALGRDSTTVLSKLSAIQAGKLGNTALLDATVHTALTATHVGGLSLSQLSLAATQTVVNYPPTARPLLIQRLDGTQLGGLSDTRMGELTSTLLALQDNTGATVLSKLSGAKVDKLSATVLGTASVFQALTVSQLSGLQSATWSTTLAGLLTGAQVTAAMTNDSTFIFKRIGTDYLYKSLSASGIGGIDTARLTEAQVIQVLVTDLTDAQAAGLTADQLGYATTTPLANFGNAAPILIRMLSGTQLGNLSAGVADLTASLLLATTSGNEKIVTKLSANAAALLSNSVLQDADVLAALGTTQVGGLTLSQLSVASTGSVPDFQPNDRPLVIQRLTDTQLLNLSDAVLGTLTYAILSATNSSGATILSKLSATEVGKLSDSVLLNADVLTALSDAQVAGLSLAQLGLAATQAVTGFLSSERPLLIQRLTSTQLGLLTDTRLSDLTANMLLAKDKDGNTTVSKLANDKVGKLTTTVWQSANVFQALSPSQLSEAVGTNWTTTLAGMLTSAQLDALMAADNDFIFKMLVSGNNTSPLYKSLAASGIGGIDTSLLTEAEVIQVLVTDLTDAQAAGLTAAQLGYATTTVLPAYGPTAPLLIQLLSDTRLSKLSAGVSGLTTDMLKATNSGNATDMIIKKLSAAAVGRLTGAALHDADVLAALVTAQVNNLTLGQLNVASSVAVDGFDANARPLLIQRLSATQLGELSDTVLGTLTPTLLMATNRANESIVSKLTATQVGKLSNEARDDASVLSALSSAQVAGLTLTQLTQASLQAVADFGPNERPLLIRRLTAPQLAELSDSLLGTLTETLLLATDKDGDTTVSKLAGAKVEKLTATVWKTANVFQALTATQLAALQNSTWSETLGGFLTAAQVTASQALSSAFIFKSVGTVQLYKYLSANGLSGVDPSALTDTQVQQVFATDLTAVQAAGLTLSQLNYQMKDDVTGYNTKPRLIQLLSSAQLLGLSDTALNALTSSLLLAENKVAGSVLSRLVPAAIGKLSGAALEVSGVLSALDLSKIAGLSAAQLSYQVSAAVQNSRPFLIQLLSTAQLAVLSGTALNGLTSAVLLSTDNASATILSKLSADAVGNLSGAALEDATVRGALTSGQVGGLTLSQLSYQVSAAANSGRPLFIQLLRTNQLAGLSDTVLAGLSSSMLLAQDSSNATVLSKLTAAQVGKLNGTALHTPSVLSALSNTQVGGLTLSQLNRVAIWSVTGFSNLPLLIQRLSAAQLAHLSDAVMGAITPSLLFLKNSAGHTVMSNLTADRVGKLGRPTLHNASVLTALTDTQAGGLTVDQLKLLPTLSVSGFDRTPMLIQRLTDAQLGGLSDTALDGLTANMLLAENSAGATILSKLTAAQVNKLSTTMLETASVFQALSASQLGGLSSSKWTAKTAALLTGTQVDGLMDADNEFIFKSINSDKLYEFLSPSGYSGIDLAQMTNAEILEVFATNSTQRQVTGFTLGQLSAMVTPAGANSTPRMLITMLSSGRVPFLSATVLGSITSTMLLATDSANKTVLSKLADKAVGLLNSAALDHVDVLAALTADQADSLTFEQLSRPSSAAVTGFLETERPMLIQRLSAAQLAKLSDGALESLTSSMLLGKNSSGVAVIDNLPAASVAKLGNMALQSGSVLAELDQTHVQQLTSAQLETLFSISSGKSTYVLQNLASSQYAYLTQDQLDKLWNAEYRSDVNTTASQNDKNAADQLIQSIASRLNSNQLPTWYNDLHSNNNNNLAS